MLVAPDLMTAYEAGEIDKKGVQAVQQAMIDYCELVRYCFAILDPLPNLMPQEVKEWRLEVNYDSTRAALYYPWIETADLTDGAGRTRLVPPSGHMAGVYARVDGTRGVHKAPANETIRTVLGLGVRSRRASRTCSTRSASTASVRSPAAASAFGARARSAVMRRGGISTFAASSI